MAYGLVVKDSGGVVRVDENCRLPRIVQVTPFSIGVGGSVNITVTGIAEDGTWAIGIDTNTGYYPRAQIYPGYVNLQNVGANVGTISGNLIVFRY